MYQPAIDEIRRLDSRTHPHPGFPVLSLAMKFAYMDAARLARESGQEGVALLIEKCLKSPQQVAPSVLTME
jgi:hypothetical protein